jgi:uncharacterized membrane protein HdeD (DUF308 family)
MFAFGTISRGHAALRGALAIVLGAICVIWPGVTIGVIVALFAVYCFADAIMELSRLFGSGETAGRRILMLLMAVIDVGAGIAAIAYPGITTGVLVVVVGVWAMVTGGFELAAAWSLSRSGSGWLALGGVLSVFVGILLVASPGIGAVSLALVFGIYLLAYGGSLVALAIATPEGERVDAFA